ncbi:filamentous hemagglutinin N-terminal domain-containing protein [Desmonostoc muscorum LEGE 12446]|uniref:Filamentous hemagglutinin N-terminal domain-containing protein n=1 Tax=Desmonostoc muscorum LEGE 12446 TaxID=1828758 RepID=A0A8J7D9B1_DESMC|nr:filamentous hemagglutinin N-terminal domain-containing protein [Desmonostoc muscorum]MCF2147040.1 filamentous hemagglutinin N-terminal domain-containing protein [Desmonostoc muscorum LEGE 12446]
MINQNCWNWCLRFGLLLSAALTTDVSAFAQVTADQTLGTQVTDIGLSSYISGGTTVGNTNLFHSFSSFSIPNGGGGIFLNDSSITNIFARVTGGTPSDIQGLIRTQGIANLFLMNPNGIIFGQNARLNVGGSFVATTANAIQFPGGIEFSLNSPVTANNTLLSINPTAFLFNQIANQGVNSIENRAILAVPNNKSLILLGGRVTPTPESTGQIVIDGGILGASDGRVEIGGLTAPGTVGLNVDGNKLSLTFPDGVARADILLENTSAAFTSGATGGDVVVNANNLELNSSYFFTGINRNQGTPETKAGDITVNATGVVTLNEDSAFGNSALGIGDSGNINIAAQSLKINASSIQATAAQGNSGIVNIQVEDTVSLSGTNAKNIPSGILSTVRPSDSSVSGEQIILGTPTRGKSGGINIQARNLAIEDGSFISASNYFAEDSGSIKIQATDAINLNNSAGILTNSFGANAGNLSITTNHLRVENSSQISTSNLGGGNGGNLNITAHDISLDNSLIFASANSYPGIISNVGNAGDINIVTERIYLTNNGNISSSSGEPELGETIGRGGNINVTATDFIEIDPKDSIKGSTYFITGFTARTFSNSRGGDITLKTRNILVRNGGAITTDAVGDLGGNAGNINIDASESIQLISSNGNFRSYLSTGVEAAKDNIVPIGNGGDITINTKRLQLTNGAITAGTFGKGNAGDIFILSNDGVIVDNGTINSRVGSGGVGNAGDIKIQTQRLTLTNGGGIDTQIAEPAGNLPGGQGKGGSIRIDAADAITISGTDESGNGSAISTETQGGALGQGGDIIVNTDYFHLTDNGLVSAATLNSSNGGNITVNARIFEASNGGFLTTGTFDSGKSGDITIKAADSITISANSDNVTGIFAGTNSPGNGGTISLSTTNFNLFTSDLNLPNNFAVVSTRSQGQGIAGDINITAKENYRASNSLVNARSEQAGGGNINITARNIRLLNNSDIRTDLSTGEGRGGNITLNANTIIALEDSDILAFAPEGQGGNITFNTRGLLSSPLYSQTQAATDANSLRSLISNGRVDINASGAISGNIIGVPDISFIQNSLTELQENSIDTNALIANSCIARNPKQEGTFLITGTGGLPIRPGDASASTYPTGDVQNVSRQWKKGDLIIEPEGVYRLANGDLVMSRECR